MVANVRSVRLSSANPKERASIAECYTRSYDPSPVISETMEPLIRSDETVADISPSVGMRCNLRDPYLLLLQGCRYCLRVLGQVVF